MRHKITHWYSLTRQIPVYWVVIIVLTVALPYNLYINKYNLPVAHSEDRAQDCILPYNLIQGKSDKLVRPLLFANVAAEDDKYILLKEKINNYITQKKGDGVKSVAVYFKDRNDANGRFIINADEKYNPASMIKIAFAMAMLKEAEDNPAILDKKVYYGHHSSAFHDQAFLPHQLPQGRSYSIRELLFYTLAYSDNDAAYKVIDQFNPNTLSHLIDNLQLPAIDFNTEYYLNIEEMARFFRVLYNASYLSNDMSEYALELLTKSDFNKGLISKIDTNILVARKFGERGIDKNKELHEFGIIYLKGRPYLLGIMTKGTEYPLLEEVLSEISLITFDEMNKAI